MTVIDELIIEHCPNGVEFKTIADLVLWSANERVALLT